MAREVFPDLIVVPHLFEVLLILMLIMLILTSYADVVDVYLIVIMLPG